MSDAIRTHHCDFATAYKKNLLIHSKKHAENLQGQKSTTQSQESNRFLEKFSTESGIESKSIECIEKIHGAFSDPVKNIGTN